MKDSYFNVKIFSPTEPIGLIILFVGVIFTVIILYIIYSVSINKESINDKNIRKKKEFIQTKKIRKLFP